MNISCSKDAPCIGFFLSHFPLGDVAPLKCMQNSVTVAFLGEGKNVLYQSFWFRYSAPEGACVAALGLHHLMLVVAKRHVLASCDGISCPIAIPGEKLG